MSFKFLSLLWIFGILSSTANLGGFLPFCLNISVLCSSLTHFLFRSAGIQACTFEIGTEIMLVVFAERGLCWINAVLETKSHGFRDFGSWLEPKLFFFFGLNDAD